MPHTHGDKFACAALTVTLLISSALSAGSNLDRNSSSISVQPLLGRWDLTLKAADREYPSWLEFRQENGKLTAQMVGWGEPSTAPRG
jgi:hypothetical protein